jgi:hypothetical protein
MKVHPNKIKAVADAVKRVKNGEHVMGIVTTIVTIGMVMVIKIWVGYGSDAGSLGPSFEIGAKNWPLPDSQSESVLEIKTKTADKSAKLHENTRFEELVMELERNKKVLKELLFFDLGAEVLDRDQFGNEAAKISGVFSGFSKSKIGSAGYDIKKNDVIRARQVHIWKEPTPHGPIVVEFSDEATNQVKNVLQKAGKKLNFEFGVFLCEISCQSSAGNRWPRLRHKLMERLRCKLTETSERTSKERSADLPFPQCQIETQAANMPSERRRLARANSSNPRALRVIEVSDPDPDPVQAPMVSSSSMADPSNPRRTRLTRVERDNRRRGTRQVHLDNIARAQRLRSNQVQEIDSSASSTDSVIFSGSVPGGAATSTPISQDDPNAADQSNQSNHSTDYYTAPETPGSVGAAGEADEDEDVIDVEDEDDSVPDLDAIELEIANENKAKADSEGAAGDASVPVAGAGAVDGHAAAAVDAGYAAAGPSRAAVVGGVNLVTPEGMPPPEDVITIGTSSEGDGDGDTDYLASVSPTKIPPRPQVVLPMMVENDVITLEDSSDLDSDESWVDRSPSSTSSDDDRHAEISRQELRELDGYSDREVEIPEEQLLEIERRIYDAGETPSTSDGEDGDEDGNVSGPNVPNEPTHPGGSEMDRRINFLLLESTVVIDDGIVEGEHFQANRIAYHQRTLAKELLIKSLERMIHIDNELFRIFSDPKNHWPRTINKNPNSHGIAGDENWPRGLTLSEQLVAYENGYQWVSRQPDAEQLIETHGFYHPSVFHTTGVRRVFVGEGYNRTPPPGTPMDTFNMFRDLQPIPARSSPAIVIPISPVYVPETPEPRTHFLAEKKSPPVPEVNTIPIDASVHFEHNCGLLNLELEVNNAAGAEWAHGVLDAEEALRIPPHLLPHNPFENPREPNKQDYRRSIRGVFVRLVLREDQINAAKLARGIPTEGNAKRRSHLMEILNNYDKVVREVKRISDQLEAAKVEKTAEAATIVLEGLDLNQEAIQAETARVKVENNKLRPQVRHYFTRCSDGEIVVNYEYIGYHDALFTETELRDFDKLTKNGACTATNCICPGNPSSSFHEQSNVTERLANFSGRTMAQFIPSREPTMPNGFRPLRQLRPTPGRPIPNIVTVRQPTPMPEMPEPEITVTPTNNSGTFIVQAAGMSDSDGENEMMFGIERLIPDVPAPIRRPRPNEEYWDSCNIDSE